MKPSILLIIASAFLFTFSDLETQELDLPKEFLKSSYYANKAELAICNNDLHLASIYYDSVFSSSVEVSSRDIFNRGLCAKKMGEMTLADSMLNLLISRGNSEQRLKPCYDESAIIQFKKPDNQKERNIKEIVADIIESDQHANSLRFSNMENFLQVVLDNAERIMKLTREAEMDSTISFSLENAGLNIQILHFFQLWHQSIQVKSDSLFLNKVPRLACLKNIDFEKFGFDKFLIEQMNQGNFDRFTLAHLISDVYRINLKFSVISQFDEYIMLDKPEAINKEELDLINANRKKFGIESYEDYFIKVRYADSLLTNGKPFTSIPIDEYEKHLFEGKEKCNFKLVGTYRLMMDFSDPKEAKKLYEQWLNKHKVITEED